MKPSDPDRWARLRFSIVGPLLAAPPPPGELRQRLERLAAQAWRHPTTGQAVRFSAASIEQRARRHAGGHSATPLDRPRLATPWRIWKLIKQEVELMISNVQQWCHERWKQCLAVMQERPRKRKLQTLPRRIGDLIESCLRAGLCHPEYA